MRKTAIAVTAILAFGGNATAHLPGLEEGAVFGDIEVGARKSWAEVLDEDVSAGQAIARARIALEVPNSPLGLQLDIAGAMVDSDWVSPDADIDAKFTDFRGIMHGTYAAADGFKVGLFGGFERIKFSVDNLDLDLQRDLGVRFSNLISSGDISLDTAIVGAGVLYSVADMGSVDMHVAYLNPYEGEASIDRPFGDDESFTAEDEDNETFGWQAGVGMEFDVFDGFSARADLNYTDITLSDSLDLTLLNVAGTLRYDLPALPLSISATGGYTEAKIDEFSEEAWSAAARVIWSFGQPASNVKRKMMRSASLFGDL